MWRDPGISADSYYEVRSECTNVPQSKFRIKNGKTLSPRKWNSAFSPQGHLDIAQVLSRIYKGGIHPSIRGEVWEFLLGCFDLTSTYEERDDVRERRRMQYAALKETCKAMFPLIGSGKWVTAPIISETGEPTQDPIALQQMGLETETETLESGDMSQREVNWKLTLHQIGLDVIRTDRTLVFYEKQENLSKLWDILSVYSWFDSDVGYGQGMSDLCSPMIMLLEDEADAFWCFEHLMRKLRSNFRSTEGSVGVESQLSNVALVTQVIDPKLHQRIEHLGGGDYLFAFRMIMVLFRREFSFCDSLYLWEMMWALEYDPDLFSVYEDSESGGELQVVKQKSKKQCGKFERENMRSGGSAANLPISVFMIASVLKDKSAKIMTEAKGLDDIVSILNECNGNMDAKKACMNALKLQKKYLSRVRGG